jgi:hypothetical protein
MEFALVLINGDSCMGPQNLTDCRLDSQRDLSDRLTELNPKSKLFVLRDNPVTILPALFNEWWVSSIG